MNLELLSLAATAAIQAGKDILEVYGSEFSVDIKEDKSPLTLADRKSHERIKSFLDQTEFPLLSEEGRSIPYEERKEWGSFWMVDPLDGTKEFIKRNGEFTVNIALIHQSASVLGVIYVPVTDVLYLSLKGIGAFKISGSDFDPESWISLATKLPIDLKRNKYTVVASRSHLSEETEKFIEEIKEEKGEIEFISAGSSLKICLVAEGAANIYPRFAPTMEWDTAAGQAIAEAAGKEVIDHSTGKAMAYNKENLLNNWFIVR